MKERFAEFVIRFRWPILIITALITIAAATLLPRLRADDDVLKFLPKDSPEIQLFNRVNKKFGGLDVAIVGLVAPDMFTRHRLQEVRDLTRRLGQVDGVYDVMSFTEVPDPRPGALGLTVEPVMDHVPEDAADLAALKKRVLANKNAVGNLISKDGQAAMILAFLGGDRAAVSIAADIKAAAGKAWTGQSIYYAGAPFIRLHVVGGTKADLSRLTPLVIIVVTLITFLLFPKPLGVLLSLGAVGVALVWTLGIFVLRGAAITIVDSSMPTLFVAIGGAYGIHFLGAYFKGRSPTVHGRIVEAFGERVGPVAFSAFATCAGFISFLVMDVGPMREFGCMATLGILLMLLLALTVIPAALSFSRRLPTRLGAEPIAQSLGQLGVWSLRHGRAMLIAAIVLSAVSLVGVIRVAPDSTLKTFYSDGSEPDLANRFLERHFGGSIYLQVFFEGDMRSPFVLAELRKIDEYLRLDKDVVQVSSIIDPLVMMAEAMGGRPDLPISRERTRSLYPFLEGSAAIDQIISPEKDASLVQVRLKNLPPEEINKTVEALRNYIEREIPRGVKELNVRELPEPERTARTQELIDEVSRRIVRLIQLFGTDAESAPDAARVAGAIRQHGIGEELEPGPDLTAALKAIVAEHVTGEASYMDEPDPEANAETLAEWNDRGRLVLDALEAVARHTASRVAITEALRRVLPLTADRDPDGLGLCAEALGDATADARAMIHAERLAGPVLAAASIAAPNDELKRRVIWALTDLHAPLFGFRDDSPKASPISASVTGQPVINMAFADSITRNSIYSLAVTFLLLIALLTIAFRSVAASLKALVPALVMFCLAVGIMGAAHVPVDPTTNMISAIALGVGVDYAIHFLWRRRIRRESLEQAASTVGPSIASNALQVAMGFSVLALSDMIPMQRFGLLVAMTMVLSAAATFILLPVLRAEKGAEAPPEPPADGPARSPGE